MSDGAWMEVPMPGKRYVLPKRFTVSLSEAAYARLRALNGEYGLGNNYLLTVLLENLDDIATPASLASAFRKFIAEYGAPATRPGARE